MKDYTKANDFMRIHKRIGTGPDKGVDSGIFIIIGNVL